jgi:hypothetical protein
LPAMGRIVTQVARMARYPGAARVTGSSGRTAMAVMRVNMALRFLNA